ncbi:MAG: hypothetical protein A2Y55_12585 [Actinobacteria bacterium RBG_16_68_12]|nr:MAG: hypothetical protein A2Y55_12585 [Actinobacteria bacterium RBG_16_68_12]
MAMANGKKSSAGKGGKSRKARAPRIYLTDEQQRLIISALEAGGSLDAAARAAGISPRTLRELRQRAHGDHPKRSALPQLKPFFHDVDQAIGRRLLTNEIWLSQNDPKYALKYLRASLAAEGEDEEPVRLPTAEELQQELDVLISSGAFRSPRCQEDCACDYHRDERRSS